MKRIDDTVPAFSAILVLALDVVLAVVLQLSGLWITMILVGALGALFVRRHRTAFLTGFLGVLIGWAILYTYAIVTAQGLAVADFFIGLLGFSGLGWVVIVIGCIIGGLLGATGALLGRSLIELIDDLIGGEAESESEEPSAA
ncbi:MAG: hypothetical protein ACP6KW_05020 [Candidatus Thorarchaeota archaeon]